MVSAVFSRRALLGAAVVAFAGGLGLKSRETAAISAGSYCLESREWQMLTLINKYRAANGLKSLAMSSTLAAAAEHHSRDMAYRNYFSHTLSNGTSWLNNILNHGYRYHTAKGENIAAGNSDATKTFNQWKNSAPHRANMLSSKYTAIGVGHHSSSTSRYKHYWTTTFGGVRTSGPC